MKTAIRILSLIIAALFGLVSCKSTSNPLALQIQNPAVQAQVIGDAEKVLIAGGGALLVSGGSSGAAVAAMTAQEVQNIPQLQKVLANATPATVTAAPATLPVPAATTTAP
jgi:hypothetical protein